MHKFEPQTNKSCSTNNNVQENTGYFNPLDKDLQSKVKTSWLCGPTHIVQDQHIPSYTGHVHGMYAENLHGKPFAKLTADSLNGRVQAGFIIDEHQRFHGPNHKEDYNDPRFKKTLYHGTLEDKKTTQIYQTEPQLPSYGPPGAPENVSPMDRVPIVGYQGYNPTFMNPLRKMKKMEEMRKRYTDGEVYVPESPEVPTEELEVPIVGYTGFIVGKKAENVFGESYQQTVINNEAKKYLTDGEERYMATH